MSNKFVNAFVLATAGVLAADAALAQQAPPTRRFTPGFSPQDAARLLEGRTGEPAASAVAPGQTAAALPKTSWLHPAFEQALIAEAAKRGSGFDPAGQCANRRPGVVPPNYVNNQVSGWIKGQARVLEQNGSTAGAVAGGYIYQQQQAEQQRNEGQTRTCAFLDHQNKIALSGHPQAAINMVFGIVNQAQANGMLSGKPGVADHMSDRAAENARDAALDAGARKVLPCYGQPGGLLGCALKK